MMAQLVGKCCPFVLSYSGLCGAIGEVHPEVHLRSI